MKNVLRVLACFLAVVMLCACMGACGKTESEDSNFGSDVDVLQKEDVDIKGNAPAGNKDTSSNGGSGNADNTASGGGSGTGTSSGGGSGGGSGSGSGSDGGTTVDKGNVWAPTEIQKVETKEYTIKAKGSKYADGIMLPKLSKEEAQVSYMTNTTWEYIQQESTETSPTAIYHAMLIWKEVYGVDVKIEMVDWGNFTSHLVTSVVAGTAPDVFRWVSGRPKWIQNNLVTSLDDKLDLTDKDYDVEAMQDNTSMGGHLYAAYSQGLKMPSLGIAYNKTKFSEAGETDPMTLYKQGKWNFTQFIKTAKNMTDAANNEYGLAGSGYLYPAAFKMMTFNNDGTISLNMTNPTFVKCMQNVWKLYRVENAARRTDDCRDTFPKGQDAMAICEFRDYCRMMDTAKASGTTDEYGIVPFPAYDFLGMTESRGSSTTVMEGFSISSRPKNMEGAIEFVRLVTKVGANISEELGDWGWAKSYLSSEEKTVFKNVKYNNKLPGMPEGSEATGAIDGTNDPYNNYLKYPIYLNANTSGDLSSILASAQGALEGVIYEYEVNAGLRK